MSSYFSFEIRNWSPVVFGGVSLLSIIYYAAWGRKHYEPPLNSAAIALDDNATDAGDPAAFGKR